MHNTALRSKKENKAADNSKTLPTLLIGLYKAFDYFSHEIIITKLNA